jgi:hypothetical protein
MSTSGNFWEPKYCRRMKPPEDSRKKKIFLLCVNSALARVQAREARL